MDNFILEKIILVVLACLLAILLLGDAEAESKENFSEKAQEFSDKVYVQTFIATDHIITCLFSNDSEITACGRINIENMYSCPEENPRFPACNINQIKL